MRLFAALLFVLLPVFTYAQDVTLGGMTMSYQIINDHIEITLKAPTLGWLGIGFNDQNSIVKSDLYLLRVKDRKAEGLDMYVIGAGNPKEDHKIGGYFNLREIEGKETDGSTTLKFQLPVQSKDRYDFSHEIGADFWLILAYSQSDDWDHHSMMRRHTKFSFIK
ncbi:MAG: DOMON domain-containing protein [Bacteroidota bacterium]